MSQKTILHIIDSLGTGGAETLLINANVQLVGFQHIVVYLNKPNNYLYQLNNVPAYCLDFKGWFSLPLAVIKLRKLVNKYQVQIIHSHLYYATITARLACPKNVQLISSYHSLLYEPKNTSQYSYKLLLFDRLTYRKRYFLLFVSKAVQRLVCRQVGVERNYEVLYNYVDNQYFSSVGYYSRKPLQLVMLGNLRAEKNYPTVIHALAELPNKDFKLDIYGDGQQRGDLEKLINKLQLEKYINLKGQVKYPHQVLSYYDLYIAASRFEGFGIALAEAMAVGLPCLVSDIDAHREVAEDTVIYFEPDKTESLTRELFRLISQPKKLEVLRSQSRLRAETFRKSIYKESLLGLYERLSVNS